ncbi:MAG: hypothetical protein WD738_06730 [Pirellulales bacterium]
MDVVTPSDLHKLVSAESMWCVSIYMPTHPAGRDGQQDPIRLRNLVTTAEQQLHARGMRRQQASGFLKAILKLPHDPASWRKRQQGLAVFCSEKAFAHYWLATPFDEFIAVDKRFHIKRLVPAINASPQFYVLAVSRNRIRLLKLSWQGMEMLHPKGLPVNIKEALNLQGADRGEQVHSGMLGDLGKEAGVFHGQGGHRDTQKEELVQYFRIINESLRPVLRENSWPLILAGVEYEMAIFREVSDDSHIAEEMLSGNFDYVEDKTLYTQAVPLAQKLYDKQRRQAIAKYRSLADTNLAVDDVEKVVPAACQGRVDTLLVNYRAEKFGRFNTERNRIEFISEEDPTMDLVELATAQAILHKGNVYGVTPDELHTAGPLWATLRY